MLADTYASLAFLDSQQALIQAAEKFTSNLGFERFAVSVVLDHIDAPTQFIMLNNAPPAYRPLSLDQLRGKRCPVSQHCKTRSTPIVWDRSTYVEAELDCMWEEQAPHGYGTGISLALHLPSGRHFFVGVDRTESLPDNPKWVTDVAAKLNLFASCAQEAAFSLLTPRAGTQLHPRLTPRELEALRWTIEGKTAWEVAHILKISEQTAARHLFNATRKLACANKHHAAAKALKLGLIY